MRTAEEWAAHWGRVERKACRIQNCPDCFPIDHAEALLIDELHGELRAVFAGHRGEELSSLRRGRDILTRLMGE